MKFRDLLESVENTEIQIEEANHDVIKEMIKQNKDNFGKPALDSKGKPQRGVTWLGDDEMTAMWVGTGQGMVKVSAYNLLFPKEGIQSIFLSKEQLKVLAKM